ncbi:MAG TPA: transketolase [Bacteroidales bacterium]|jgi:transketolase|nr:transketolase [Bacteroidota bacterium]HJN05595.1 transketolase [Bacteroidales bacterium]|tara:strand:+ start:628 stop:1476 length:849 start_codon:yes stop_codon:yes gene_type:complete
MSDIEKLKKIASQVRRDIIRMVHGVQSGHPGGSLGCTDFLTAMYFDVMDYNAEVFTMDALNEDLLIVSNGHISPALYSVLARRGLFPIEELSTFRILESRLQGHPATQEELPGIRIATGSLGQGLSVSLGIALAKRLNKDPKIVFCLMGDGELEEGQVWEAAMYIGSHKINNVVAVVDYNKKQIDGSTDDVLPLGDLKAKFEAFGWTVIEMNGNDIDDVVKTMSLSKTLSAEGNPIIVLMHTEMGMGVDFMMGTHQWHGIPPNDKQLETALSQIEETLGDYS